MATFIFSEVMDDATLLPTVNVNYPDDPTSDELDLAEEPLINIDSTTWNYAIPLNTSGLDTLDGVIALTLNSRDLAGNIVPADSIT